MLSMILVRLLVPAVRLVVALAILTLGAVSVGLDYGILTVDVGVTEAKGTWGLECFRGIRLDPRFLRPLELQTVRAAR